MLLFRLNITCMKSPFLGLILPQTAKSSHHLVHFIQQDDWVLDANCFQCIQNSSWHGSYVSAPITRYQPKSPQFKEIRNQKKEGNGDEKVTTMSRYPTYPYSDSLPRSRFSVSSCNAPPHKPGGVLRDITNNGCKGNYHSDS